MDIIQLLPDSVANQIAAGEVIQRPASVIKELVENAVDAGSAHIVVNILDAGKTSIQVIDDGNGMSETDARLSFERHATSKIRNADDLFALHTMGFRGEALASIAAVAQVELNTRPADNDLGCQLIVEGGRVIEQKMVACQQGCNFNVRNLFFNVPARRKFLKSNQTELHNIMVEMERMTLVNNSVSFRLTHNGQELLDLPSSGRLQRIVSVFGKKMHDSLLPVDVDTTMCHISGFVGKPESAKKKGAQQFFFVNNRYMKHPYFHKAVVEAFDKLVPADSQVPYFLYFDVPPSDIDVNIHPTKTEIKFENELAIWQILMAAIRESLGSFNAMPTIDFEQDTDISIPAFSEDKAAAQRFMSSPSIPLYDPFAKREKATPSGHVSTYSPIPSDVTPNAMTYALVVDEQCEMPFQDADAPVVVDKSVNHYQLKGRYILTSVKSGLMIVDQHRAHVRVLYERNLRLMDGHQCATQGLLFPEVVTLSAADSLLMDEIMDSLSNAGFDISSLGGGAYSVNGMPADLDFADVAAVISGILSTVRDCTSGVGEDLNKRLALELAHRQAMNVGEFLDNESMESLLSQLFATSVPNYTPDGRIVVKIIPQSDIDDMFG